MDRLETLTWERISIVAVEVCTERQLDVLRLWTSGMGTTRIALALGISRSTARDHLLRAQQKIRIEIERDV
jgi:DNA-binding CsgD family transcriptional regulator